MAMRKGAGFFPAINDRRYVRYVRDERELLEAWGDAARDQVGYIGIVDSVSLRQPLVWNQGTDALVVEGLGDGGIIANIGDRPVFDVASNSLTLQNLSLGGTFRSLMRVKGTRFVYIDNVRFSAQTHSVEGADSSSYIRGRVRDMLSSSGATWTANALRLAWHGGYHQGAVSITDGFDLSMVGVMGANAGVTVSNATSWKGSIVGCVSIGTVTVPGTYATAANT